MDPDERSELQDFEARFRHQLTDTLEKLDDLPYDARAETWAKLKQRFREHEKATAELEEKEPDLRDKLTEGKHKSLVEFFHRDADAIAKKALESQRAKDMADQFKSREAAGAPRQQGKDHER